MEYSHKKKKKKKNCQKYSQQKFIKNYDLKIQLVVYPGHDTIL